MSEDSHPERPPESRPPEVSLPDDLPATSTAPTSTAPSASAERLVERGAWVMLAGLVALILLLTALAPVPEDVASPMGSLEFRFQARYALGAHDLFQGVGSALAPQLTGQLVDQLREVASSDAEKLCLVPVLAEIDGVQAALAEIAELHEAELSEPVAADLALFERLYLDDSATLPEAERLALLERRGFFAELVLARDDDGAPAALYRQARRTAVAILGLLGAIFLATGAGFMLLVAGLVARQRGRLRLHFQPPAAAPLARRLPFLETLVVFILATLGFGVLGGLLQAATGHPSVALVVATFALVAVGWPLVRGMGLGELRRGFGWQRGTGVLREMAWGVAGYLAGLPLLALALLVSLALAPLVDAPARHPLMDGLAESGPGHALLLFAVAALWAPLVEETVFRGAFYHYLRGRWGILASAVVTSAVFALIHPQGILGVPPLFTLAMILALVREWRGSLVGSVTIHAVHNGLTVAALFLVFA